MQMPGRDTTYKSSYRYGFNGKEMDNETYGQGNEYEYGDRIYNPRIGRFLSLDPLQAKYPFYTPYSFAGNSPIENIDLDGREELPYTEKNQFGEKQVHMVPIQVMKPFRGGAVWATDYKEVNPAGKPVTQGLSERDIYRLVLARVISPGDFKIPDDQYLDKTYFSTEEKVKYYFSHLLTVSAPNTKEERALASQIHTLVANAILGPNAADADAGIEQIKRRNQWINKFDWASMALSFVPGSLIQKVGDGLSTEAKFAQKWSSESFSAEGNVSFPKNSTF
jgi:RHS repeat-associated protein